MLTFQEQKTLPYTLKMLQYLFAKAFSPFTQMLTLLQVTSTGDNAWEEMEEDKASQRYDR